MASYNMVLLIGHLVRDVELREASGGIKYCNFSIGVNRISKSGAQEAADFIECTAFGKTAEFMAKWCKKGTALIVIGSLQNNNYDDKNGVKHYSYKVLAREVQFAESKSDKTVTSIEDAEKQVLEEVENDDQLPF